MAEAKKFKITNKNKRITPPIKIFSQFLFLLFIEKFLKPLMMILYILYISFYISTFFNANFL